MPTTDHDKQVLPGLAAQAEARYASGAGTEKEKVALPPALRAVALTPEEADTIREVLDDPGQPAHTGAEMPTADASFLLDTGRQPSPPSQDPTP